jgi:3-oxoadipate enol-lactonase
MTPLDFLFRRASPELGGKQGFPAGKIGRQALISKPQLKFSAHGGISANWVLVTRGGGLRILRHRTGPKNQPGKSIMPVQQISANGVNFNCAIDGPEGAPWITFSNSLATNISMWDAQIEALGNDYRMLRYDKRGHGATEPVEGPYNWDMLVGDVVALWDALGIEKSHFVGLSMGGMTAFGLAQDHADRLIGTVASNTRADAPPEFRDSWDGRIATVQENGMAAMAAPTVERWCSDHFLASGSPTLDRMKDMVASTSVTGFVGCAHALKELNFQDRLGDIDTPMLFIGGKEDGATPSANMKLIHQQVAGSKFIELSPAGHLSNMEQPEGYTAALREFLGSF